MSHGSERWEVGRPEEDPGKTLPTYGEHGLFERLQTTGMPAVRSALKAGSTQTPAPGLGLLTTRGFHSVPFVSSSHTSPAIFPNDVYLLALVST